MTRSVIAGLYKVWMPAFFIVGVTYFLWQTSALSLPAFLAVLFIAVTLCAGKIFSSGLRSRRIKNSKSINDSINAAFKIAYQYPIAFTENVLHKENPLLLQAIGSTNSLMVVIDEGVLNSFPDCSEKVVDYLNATAGIKLACDPILLPAGEEAKTQQTIGHLQQQMLNCQLDRFSKVIVIGGGSVLDAAGYACATFHRGIGIIRLPTTILGQNDAGVGVKNAINSCDTKNLIGTFAPPVAVINDFQFIATLPDRDKLSGMAEAVKVAAIRDRKFFQWLESNARRLANFEADALKYMIRQCAELHIQQICKGEDPFESGNVRPLDFGHWSAHKLESLSHYQLRHGEAVAIGMALDTRYAVDAGILDSDCGIRMFRLLEKLGFKLWHPAINCRSEQGRFELLDGLEEFRQHLGGQLSITLLTGIGRAKEFNHLSSQRVTEGIRWLEQRAAINFTAKPDKAALVVSGQGSFQAG